MIQILIKVKYISMLIQFKSENCQGFRIAHMWIYIKIKISLAVSPNFFSKS